MERWNGLYELAASQGGYFTVSQAADCGFSLQLLEHHSRSGRLQRCQRGIYRLAHFPPTEYDDLIILWLWSEEKGIFSHGTALALHNLSDYLPARHHLTVPLSWKKRRLRVPGTLQLYYADVPPEEQSHYGCVRITRPARTLADCAQTGLSPEWLDQARKQAEKRGLLQITAVR